MSEETTYRTFGSAPLDRIYAYSSFVTFMTDKSVCFPSEYSGLLGSLTYTRLVLPTKTDAIV